MLHQQLREEWRARERVMSIFPVMTLAPDGLVLGAGTVLLRSEGPCRLQSLHGQEARLLGLLAVAYGEEVAPRVLGNIERASKSWRDGDQCLAYIHLVHSGLRQPGDIRAAACRLFIAESAMNAGMSPRAVLQALKIGGRYLDAIEKSYNPDEPRVPAGSGRTSNGAANGGGDASEDKIVGVGAGDASLLARMSVPASSILGELDAGQVAELGAYASRLLGLGPFASVAAAFGLLFIPSPNNVRVEGDVPGIPGLRYSWNCDETVLHLTHGDIGDAPRTFVLQVDGDLVRDDEGKVVGRVIGGNRIALETLAVLPDLLKQGEPRLCPAYAPDVAGSDQGKSYEENRSRQYEDFVKPMINPPPTGPTPSGFAYYLPNSAEGGKPVSYDDCKWMNGILFEIKGERLANLTEDLPEIMAADFVGQATRQLGASGGRPLVWVFAEERAARFARDLFDHAGLDRISVVYCL